MPGSINTLLITGLKSIETFLKTEDNGTLYRIITDKKVVIAPDSHGTSLLLHDLHTPHIEAHSPSAIGAAMNRSIAPLRITHAETGLFICNYPIKANHVTAGDMRVGYSFDSRMSLHIIDSLYVEKDARVTIAGIAAIGSGVVLNGGKLIVSEGATAIIGDGGITVADPAPDFYIYRKNDPVEKFREHDIYVNNKAKEHIMKACARLSGNGGNERVMVNGIGYSLIGQPGGNRITVFSTAKSEIEVHAGGRLVVLGSLNEERRASGVSLDFTRNCGKNANETSRPEGNPIIFGALSDWRAVEMHRELARKVALEMRKVGRQDLLPKIHEAQKDAKTRMANR